MVAIDLKGDSKSGIFSLDCSTGKMVARLKGNGDSKSCIFRL